MTARSEARHLAQITKEFAEIRVGPSLGEKAKNILEVISGARSTDEVAGVFNQNGRPPMLDDLASLVAISERALEIRFTSKALIHAIPQVAFDDQALAMLMPGQLDLLILVEHPDFGNRSYAQMLAPLKNAVDALGQGGRLVVVQRNQDVSGSFTKLAQVAEALGLSVSAIDLSRRAATGLILSR